MNIQKTAPVSFKGLDAGKIKKLHIVKNMPSPTAFSEIQNAAKQEGIELDCLSIFDTSSSYLQDIFSFVNIKGKNNFLFSPMNAPVPDTVLEKTSKNYETKESYDVLTGGNFYLGKKPNGEKWLLIGGDGENFEPFSTDDVLTTLLQMIDQKDTKAISSLYDVKEENIHYISSPEYHLDMTIRPIGYPYVLVNDPKLAMAKTKKMRKFEQERIGQMFQNSLQEKQYLKAADKQIEDLKKAGFVPIRIAGIYGQMGSPEKSYNFMNAIVNTHPDGSISYITNSTECGDLVFSKLQKQFERDLKDSLEKAPKFKDIKPPTLRKAYFIAGDYHKDRFGKYNDLMIRDSGVHCYCAEELEEE